ncbi:hypothetical protein M422DRAFT_23793 [Sphaerobolus stellatus SS14]|nr:hypothetical protein M422DRAFT_23793 [Sphaerobolus stellatus SS14]
MSCKNYEDAHSFHKHCDEINLRDSDLLSGEILGYEIFWKSCGLREVLDETIPEDMSADRAIDVWDHLYPSKPWWKTLNLSNLWEHFEEMLPLWKQQFIHNDTGEWILIEEFVGPDDVPESSSPSSNIPPSEDPHPSSVSEETETPYQYVSSTTPFLPQESSNRGTYDFPDPIPQVGPSGSYQLSPLSYPGGGNPAYPNTHTQPSYFSQADGFNTFQ